MFFNEARLASRIKHPNIVDIFDQGEADSTYFLAMEYIHGEDLRGLAQQSDAVGKRPALALICRIIMDTLAGLYYAHTLLDERGQPLGLVHRDVSPQNVLVTYDGVVKLIDFGIAKATRMLDSEQTQAGMIKGKYAYMSPEQTRGEQLDARSDLFSVGTLLWELLTWRRLFKRQTDLATLVAVTEEPAPSMLAVNPEIPKELDDITLRALAPNRDDRYSSAKEFHDALAGFIRRSGWDASREALGRYMSDIFAEKLAKEGAPLAIEEKQSAGLPIGHRLPPPRPQPGSAPQSGQGASGGRPRAMTMPLQVINPALAQQARKAMVMPKSGNSLPGTPPPPPNPDSPSRQSTGAPSSRSGASSRAPQQPQPPAPDPSMPMRIVPDNSNALRPPPAADSALRPPVPGIPQLVTPPSLIAAGESAAGLVPSSSSRPNPELSTAGSTGMLSPASDVLSRRRVWLAVAVGVFIGVVAVFLLQLIAARNLH